MNRRELLGLLGRAGAGTALAGLAPEELFAQGTGINRRVASDPVGALGPFTEHQSQTVSRIADLIIPRTDTPGAADAGVHRFIAVIVGEWYLDEDRDLFLKGLADIDGESRQRFSADFIDAGEANQVTLLTARDAELQAMRGRKEDTGKNFFQRMKGLTLYGYYTSEAGMVQELRYQVIPGRFDSCTPFGPSR